MNGKKQQSISKVLNRLAQTPVRIAQEVQTIRCIWCGQPILIGTIYRDAGEDIRSHEDCLREMTERYGREIDELQAEGGHPMAPPHREGAD